MRSISLFIVCVVLLFGGGAPAFSQVSDAQVEQMLIAACDGDDVASCKKLSAYYFGQVDKTAPADSDEQFAIRKKSAEAMAKSCDAGDKEACFEAGNMYVNGRGPYESRMTAVKFHEKACKLEHGRACSSLAVSNPKSREGQIALLRRGCFYDPQYGCMRLGDAYLQALGIERDLERAFGLYAGACKAGSKAACNMVASNERRLVEKLDKPDSEPKEWPYQCWVDRRAASCHFYAKYLEELIFEKDVDFANGPMEIENYTQLSCFFGFVQDCMKVARMDSFLLSDDHDKTRKYFAQLACDLDQQAGCELLEKLQKS
ncbi:tetratricopeptide repeat protein [Kordiimonas sp. SCSIO 12610]|uniref:tetratricopeptide repeat protein n=1 Tax=Kordiimonas sp. SCSIO 12610 TaxID=2829597 RepID=UPI00210899E9|nr:tetratricopeptide repeat protein [Kordiimonas sp. SCSIO 12610]UTW56247.1 sel1 repeat family protein [Kordiimonas sp. SCSIO 12610]